MKITIRKAETLEAKPLISIWFGDKQVILKEDEFESLKENIESFNTGEKETALEVPVQEQPKVTFEYLIECPSRIILTNDKDAYNNLITQYECNIMINPEINKFTTGYKCVLSSQSDDIYLVQIHLDK